MLFGLVQGFVAAAFYFSLGLVVQRARATPGSSTSSAAVSSCSAPLLRRGRLAAPGARRRDGHRPLRLQRAVELRRRLGDPARLHHPDRADGVRGDRLPGGAVRAARGRARGVPVRRRGRRRRRAGSTSAAPARGASSASPSSRSPTSALQTTIVILGLALLFDPDVLTDPASVAGTPSTTDLVFAFTLTLVAFAGSTRRRASPARWRSAAAGSSAWSRARLLAVHPLRRHRARGRQRAAARRPGCARARTTTSTRRCSASRRASSRRGCATRCGCWSASPPFAILVIAVQRRDARPLAARLLARAQPPDPVRDRPAAPDARDAGRGHRRRRAAGDRAADPGRPRVPRRRSTPSARRSGVHARAPLGDPAALARARPRPPVQGAAERPHRPRRAAGDRRARRADVGRRLRRRASPCTTARAGPASAGWRSGSRSTSSTAWSRASRSSSASRSRSGR